MSNIRLKKSDYNYRQYLKPYYSTILFDKFLNKNCCLKPNTNIMDIGAGCGANIYYFGKRYPKITFLGLDYNKKSVQNGNEILKNFNLKNISLKYGDLFKVPDKYKGKFEGIFNIHTLCCFKNLKPVLKALIKLHPKWIAFNSLFYEGPLDVLIHIRDYNDRVLTDDNPDGDFNIFSLSVMKRILKENGYQTFIYERFNIPVDLPKPKNGIRGSYTLRTDFDRRAIFSGPVYLPWFFVLTTI